MTLREPNPADKAALTKISHYRTVIHSHRKMQERCSQQYPGTATAHHRAFDGAVFGELEHSLRGFRVNGAATPTDARISVDVCRIFREETFKFVRYLEQHPDANVDKVIDLANCLMSLNRQQQQHYTDALTNH